MPEPSTRPKPRRAVSARRASGPSRRLSPAEAAAWLVHTSGLGRHFSAGAAGIVELVDTLGVIQLDPIDRAGSSPELVAWARVPGLGRGDLFRGTAGRVFEHFAKERCMIDARFFPYYRDQAVETPWWRHSDRMKRVPAALLDDVEAEIRARGPLPSDQLEDRGVAEPLDWSGWKSTSSLAALAAEILWTTCRLVVAARDHRGRRIYDLPERALGAVAASPRLGAGLSGGPGSFAEVMLLERVRAAGLLARAGGPTWSMLSEARTDGTVDRLVADGRLVEVTVGEKDRPYLALPTVLDGAPAPRRQEAVVVAPLDPLVWDRALVQAAFGFEYVWEVYKPAAARRWGYYVCPVFADGALISRVEARRNEETLHVAILDGARDARVLDALDRLRTCNGCKKLQLDASIA